MNEQQNLDVFYDDSWIESDEFIPRRYFKFVTGVFDTTFPHNMLNNVDVYYKSRLLFTYDLFGYFSMIDIFPIHLFNYVCIQLGRIYGLGADRIKANLVYGG